MGYFSSGFLAFTASGPPIARLLLASDSGIDTVHVIDVVGRVHVGYVAAPGSIPGPRGVAVAGSMVAVSAWSGVSFAMSSSCQHIVHLFQGGGASWTAVRVLAGGVEGPSTVDGHLARPYGLRFSRDGVHLAVADRHNDRVSLFRTCDGAFQRHVVTGIETPYDVEECEGGWLVACGHSLHMVTFVSGHAVGEGARFRPEGSSALGRRGAGAPHMFQWPSGLALAPGLGLFVREDADQGRVRCFATPDAVAMASMSRHRVAWMGCVVRGILQRRCVPSQR
jgi:hypothetical protein